MHSVATPTVEMIAVGGASVHHTCPAVALAGALEIPRSCNTARRLPQIRPVATRLDMREIGTSVVVAAVAVAVAELDGQLEVFAGMISVNCKLVAPLGGCSSEGEVLQQRQVEVLDMLVQLAAVAAVRHILVATAWETYVERSVCTSSIDPLA